jgi:hypothetical protein
MPSKKWQKLMEKSPASFRRGRPTREPAASILVVTEGQVSEPAYFNEMRRRLKLGTVELEVEPGEMGDPRRLAERACEINAERRSGTKKRKMGFFQPRVFDELWIVFDTDAPAVQGRLHSGLSFAQANGVRCAHSTPCFEFWLLRHHVFTTAPMRVCSDVIPRLSEAIGARYTKNAGESAQIIPPILGRLELALENAGRIRNHHAAGGSPFPANPSTEVDCLIHSILKACNLDASSV